MFSHFGNDDNSSYAGSIQSNGYTTTNLDEAPSQIPDLSRPNAKSIYLQRKAYAASTNQMMDSFQHRVEHLYSCDLDGKELRTVSDCMERLKLLEEMGRVWGQNMLLEVRGLDLLLTDTETKEELESFALSDILELKADLETGKFNSLLIITVKSGRRGGTTVLMFQCEDMKAELVQTNLSQVISRRRDNPRLYVSEEQSGYTAAQTYEPKDQRRSDQSWTNGYDDEDKEEAPSFIRTPSSENHHTPPQGGSDLDRSVDFLNQTLNDVELFVAQVSAAAATEKKKKKKNKKVSGMPPTEEFAVCFQKIKCGFNLLGELDGRISNPSAPEFVHALFSILAFLIPHCPENLPKSIVSPKLTPQCVHLIREEVSAEERHLWQSLGDAWINLDEWPQYDQDDLSYTQRFSDDWQHPGDTTAEPELSGPERRPERRPEPAVRQTSTSWSPEYQPPPQQQPPRSSEDSKRERYVRVLYDFTSRNNRELTVTKGEIVEVLDTSRQWWKVMNSSGEEGYVPNNVLQTDEPSHKMIGSPFLTRNSKPPEVRAWLENQGFSKITVRCLGVLSSSMLLGMTREELKLVCPEEGGRVFHELQAVRSNMA